MQIKLAELEDFIKMAKAAKPTIETLERYVASNIKEICLIFLSKDPKFLKVFVKNIPALKRSLLFYPYSVDYNLIKSAISNAGVALPPKITEWLLSNYTIDEILEIVNYNTQIHIPGMVVELNNIDEYTKLINMLLNQGIRYGTLSVVSKDNTFLVFFG